MRYILVIKRNPSYTPDVERVEKESWQQVTHFLRHHLDKHTINVEVTKWSSDGKCLLRRDVNMSNVCDIVLSLRDNCLTT